MSDKIVLGKYEDCRLGQMVKSANRDSDRASAFILGNAMESADGAIIIVKGTQATWAVYNLLVERGFITPGKPIEDWPEVEPSVQVMVRKSKCHSCGHEIMTGSTDCPSCHASDADED